MKLHPDTEVGKKPIFKARLLVTDLKSDEHQGFRLAKNSESQSEGHPHALSHTQAKLPHSVSSCRSLAPGENQLPGVCLPE